MAFSLSEEHKAKVRQYLAYPYLADKRALYADQLITIPQNELLEKAMDSIFTEETKQVIIEIIENIDCIREQIKAARKRLSMKNIAYVGEMNNHEIAILWNEDLGYCKELANQLQVPLYWHRNGGGISQTGISKLSSYMDY